jgi:hypothetical protein
MKKPCFMFQFGNPRPPTAPNKPPQALRPPQKQKAPALRQGLDTLLYVHKYIISSTVVNRNIHLSLTFYPTPPLSAILPTLNLFSLDFLILHAQTVQTLIGPPPGKNNHVPIFSPNQLYQFCLAISGTKFRRSFSIHPHSYTVSRRQSCQRLFHGRLLFRPLGSH